MAYPELVSREVSERLKCKSLVRVSVSNGVTPIADLKKPWPGGVSGQPENPPGYATGLPVFIFLFSILIVPILAIQSLLNDVGNGRCK